MRKRTLTICLAIFALLALAACSNSTSNQGSQKTSTTSTSASPAQAYNQQDVMFAQHMIPHHQQAIQMSDIVLSKQGIDPRVVQLANQIKAAQGPEIQQMQGWLSAWGQPTMPMTPGMMPNETMMPSHTMMPSQSAMPGMEGMTGMMSQADMDALQNAQGVDAGKLFLTQMIQHHQGAIAMAQHEIDAGQYQPAVALARSIVTSQQQEINAMQGILATL